MRYIRKQIVTKVLADEVVDDPLIIKELLITFQKARTDAAISYRKNSYDLPTSHERVRITNVEDNTFDITVINSTHSMTVRKIPIQDVEYICTTVSPSEAFIRKEKVEKGDVIDLT